MVRWDMCDGVRNAVGVLIRKCETPHFIAAQLKPMLKLMLTPGFLFSHVTISSVCCASCGTPTTMPAFWKPGTARPGELVKSDPV